MKKYTEARLEDVIVDHLCESGGFVSVDYRGYRQDRRSRRRYSESRRGIAKSRLLVFPDLK